MQARSILKLVVAAALAGAALIVFVAPGTGASDRRQRANEYPLAVVITKTIPKRPKTGKPFTAMIGVFNQDTQDVVHSAHVACPARIGHPYGRCHEQGRFQSTCELGRPPGPLPGALRGGRSLFLPPVRDRFLQWRRQGGGHRSRARLANSSRSS